MTDNQRNESCKSRWALHKQGRFSDLRKLWKAYCAGQEDVTDLGNIYDYGLSFDYVAPNTFSDQKRGYWRYQLSWGGPSDEIRFYADSPNARTCDRIEYVFMDWFDGHARKLRGKDEALAQELWDWFRDAGSTASEYTTAMEDAD